MNWMTVVWPMVTAACLTLALINLRIAFGDVRRMLRNLAVDDENLLAWQSTWDPPT